MIDFPPDTIISTTLEVGTIYLMSAPELIETKVKHYFIVVGIDEDDNYLLLCSSQKDRMVRHFLNRNLNHQGLITIQKDSMNGLREETYVNCNDSYEIKLDALIRKARNKELIPVGKISLTHYILIRKGITNSITNDIPISLLKHPDE